MKNLKQFLMRKKSISIRNTKSRDELGENCRDIRKNSGNDRFKKYAYFF